MARTRKTTLIQYQLARKARELQGKTDHGDSGGAKGRVEMVSSGEGIEDEARTGQRSEEGDYGTGVKGESGVNGGAPGLPAAEISSTTTEVMQGCGTGATTLATAGVAGWRATRAAALRTAAAQAIKVAEMRRWRVIEVAS